MVFLLINSDLKNVRHVALLLSIIYPFIYLTKLASNKGHNHLQHMTACATSLDEYFDFCGDVDHVFLPLSELAAHSLSKL